jgi:hypothetical protein
MPLYTALPNLEDTTATNDEMIKCVSQKDPKNTAVEIITDITAK